MVEYIRHLFGGLVLFAVAVTLWVGIYSDFEQAYGIVRTGTDDNGRNVMESIEDINIISAINQTASGLYKIVNPQNAADLIGASTLVGIGSLKFVGGVVTLPLDIIAVITDFYFIPKIIPTAIGLILLLYVGFIILSAYLKERV